ncbi:MAG: hypothetical protein MOB07_07260 [Acidobacteria bacterium]|nr:hypothetical protein [Acidobacteriota bacterium]
MPLPEFNSLGDLPEGVHRTTFDEALARFGQGSLQRQRVTARLNRVYELAQKTGKLERFVIFGSYVTAKSDPNDVDIILVMRDDFREQDYSEETLPVFNHLRAQRELGASVFWIRADMVLLETVDQFVAHWQVKRDLTRRGIVEIILEVSE